MPKCIKKSCDRPGTKKIALLLFSSPDGVPSTLMFNGVLVCPECSKDMKAEDLTTDEGWAQIVDCFKQVGREEPVRELSKVKFTDTN